MHHIHSLYVFCTKEVSRNLHGSTLNIWGDDRSEPKLWHCSQSSEQSTCANYALIFVLIINLSDIPNKLMHIRCKNRHAPLNNGAIWNILQVLKMGILSAKLFFRKISNTYTTLPDKKNNKKKQPNWHWQKVNKCCQVYQSKLIKKHKHKAANISEIVCLLELKMVLNPLTCLKLCEFRRCTEIVHSFIR